MKKLLLVTKSFVCILLIASCQTNSKTITKNETKPSMSATNIDTSKHASQVSSSGTAVTNSGTKKDTTIQTTKATAINHNSQNQAQLDSLKAIKTKDKNKKDK